MTVRNWWLILLLTCLTQPATSHGQVSTSQPSDEIVRESTRTDFNRSIFYKNKLEFSMEAGWLPINIPFVFDFLLGDGYNKTPLKYTLVPIIASLRWQMDDVRGPSILRGNWDLSLSGAFTVIPRGPETRYGAYDMGIRRNFVRPNWRIVPYFDGRLGLGGIDAKGPKGAVWAQGQDFTFTLMLGSGVRYNVNSRYAISAGVNYMHISNLYLSEPKFPNYGINVYGPMVGVDIRLGKPKRESAQRGP
jgi:lipid A 3-O-deacylase PagL